MKGRLLPWLLLLLVNVANAQLIGAGRRGVSGSGSITETDPTVSAAAKGITAGLVGNWNTAYGWGNHASAGYTTSTNTQTFSNKTISGSNNTFSSIPSTAISNTTFPTLAGANAFAQLQTFSDAWANYQAKFGSTGQAGRIGFATGTGAIDSYVGYATAGTVTDFLINNSNANGQITLVTNAVRRLSVLPTGQVMIQNGGTFTNSGEQFQLVGTAKLDGAVRTTGALSVSSTGQQLLYNTTDEVTNFERVSQGWSTNIFRIKTEAGGTGLNRVLQLDSGTSSIYVNSINGNATNPGFFNFSRSTGSAGLFIGVSGTFTASSGNISSFGICPTINQTANAGYTAYYASVHEQAVGNGTKLLIDVGVNSAVNNTGTHTPKFTVSNTGRLNFADAPVYADNAAATTAGLPVGTVYRTSTGVLMIRY